MRNLIGHIMFAGGGTAGHLFPGLAVAEHLRQHAPKLRISFAGTGKPLESQHVVARGVRISTAGEPALSAQASETLRFLTDNVAGYYAARRYLRDEHVALVVGLGGYASVPSARAAAAEGIEYVLLEQNAVPGRATRWLAPGAAVVCSTFEGIRPFLKHGARVRVTGNPLAECVHRKCRAGATCPTGWAVRGR